MQPFLSTIDLPHLVLDTGFPLKRHKDTEWSGNTCPECGSGTERSSRFTVFVGRDHCWHWQCFACGAHGDAADFLAAANGMSVGDALKELRGKSPQAAHRVIHRCPPRVSAVNDAEQTHAICQVIKTLLSSAHGTGAREYLKGRGIADATIDMAIAANQLRMLPSNPEEARAWLFEHVGRSTLRTAGMLHEGAEWPALAFRPLLAISLCKHALEARSIGLNERDKDYSKSLSYGRAQRPWYFARSQHPHRVLVTEGFIDALSAFQLAPATDAFLSVPGVTRWCGDWFRAFHARFPDATIGVGFDTDAPGNDAARKLGNELKALGIRATRRTPAMYKDWNEALVQRQRKAA